MTPANEDRRKNDQERWEKIAAFMSKIDERNFHKDLALTVKEELEAKQNHEGRIASLEHSRTKYNTIAKGITATGFLAGMIKKFGHYF